MNNVKSAAVNEEIKKNCLLSECKRVKQDGMEWFTFPPITRYGIGWLLDRGNPGEVAG